MRPDVDSYLRFYGSPLGQVVPAMLAAQIVATTSQPPSGQVVGLGFALPVLDILAENIPRALAVMPAQQGCIAWPSHSDQRALMAFDHKLPLPDGSVDQLYLVHMLEHASRPHRLMREIWRVLAPGGRVTVVVPNRGRMWSALEITPFGQGRPYSRRQLAALLTDHLLTPGASRTALLMPPLIKPWGARLCAVLEAPLLRVLPDMGGVLIMTAEKQVEGTISGHRHAAPVRAPAAATSQRPLRRRGTANDAMR